MVDLSKIWIIMGNLETYVNPTKSKLFLKRLRYFLDYWWWIMESWCFGTIEFWNPWDLETVWYPFKIPTPTPAPDHPLWGHEWAPRIVAGSLWRLLTNTTTRRKTACSNGQNRCFHSVSSFRVPILVFEFSSRKLPVLSFRIFRRVGGVTAHPPGPNLPSRVTHVRPTNKIVDPHCISWIGLMRPIVIHGAGVVGWDSEN